MMKDNNTLLDTNFRSAAVAALALGAAFAAAPASAQDVAAPAGARVFYDQPAVADEPAAVPPNAMGHFTCAYNETHTRLERKNCGGSHYRYGF